MVKNLPVMQETVHSSILVWKVPMDRAAWWAASPCGRKESDKTKHARVCVHAHTHTHTYTI